MLLWTYDSFKTIFFFASILYSKAKLSEVGPACIIIPHEPIIPHTNTQQSHCGRSWNVKGAPSGEVCETAVEPEGFQVWRAQVFWFLLVSKWNDWRRADRPTGENIICRHLQHLFTQVMLQFNKKIRQSCHPALKLPNDEQRFTAFPLFSIFHTRISPVVKLIFILHFNSREHKGPPVAGVVRARVVHPHDDEDMLKVWADGLGSEGVSAGLLEHDGHNVVPYVSLPQQLVVKEQGSY